MTSEPTPLSRVNRGRPCSTPKTPSPELAALRQLLETTERIALEQTLRLESAMHELASHGEELERSRQALATKSGLLESVLESMASGVVAVDRYGRFSLYNEAAQHVLGQGPLAGNPHDWPTSYGLYLPDGATLFPAEDLPLARALRGETVDGAEMFVWRPDLPDGTWLSVSARPLLDSAGHITGAMAIFRDVSRQKRAETARTEFERRLQQSNKELEEFAFAASHDLQEPLRKILAFGELLCSEYGAALPEQARDYVLRMQGGAVRMQSLIRDLLDYSRITSRGETFIPVDLGDVAREVVDHLEMRIRESTGSVELGELPAVQADPTQMFQLLQNLVSNALKFRKPDVAPVVKVWGRTLQSDQDSDRGQCELTVSDNGIGFEQRFADRIFGVFQRLHSRHAYEGTGIGLAICRKIVSRHGGSIQALSSPGEGTRFVVRLPAARAPEVP
ncbi:MAG: PAS domain-containing protein [Candidatus Wallbacteria bacterium]|nr:PAS domain-containing protein [Candidatus Wallbacteria bacterium]